MKANRTIRFGTKEESNERKIKETLDRTGHERLMFFVQLCKLMTVSNEEKFHPNEIKGNFTLRLLKT